MRGSTRELGVLGIFGLFYTLFAWRVFHGRVCHASTQHGQSLHPSCPEAEFNQLGYPCAAPLGTRLFYHLGQPTQLFAVAFFSHKSCFADWHDTLSFLTFLIGGLSVFLLHPAASSPTSNLRLFWQLATVVIPKTFLLCVYALGPWDKACLGQAAEHMLPRHSTFALWLAVGFPLTWRRQALLSAVYSTYIGCVTLVAANWPTGWPYRSVSPATVLMRIGMACVLSVGVARLQNGSQPAAAIEGPAEQRLDGGEEDRATKPSAGSKEARAEEAGQRAEDATGTSGRQSTAGHAAAAAGPVTATAEQRRDHRAVELAVTPAPDNADHPPTPHAGSNAVPAVTSCTQSAAEVDACAADVLAMLPLLRGACKRGRPYRRVRRMQLHLKVYRADPSHLPPSFVSLLSSGIKSSGFLMTGLAVQPGCIELMLEVDADGNAGQAPDDADDGVQAEGDGLVGATADAYVPMGLGTGADDAVAEPLLDSVLAACGLRSLPVGARVAAWVDGSTYALQPSSTSVGGFAWRQQDAGAGPSGSGSTPGYAAAVAAAASGRSAPRPPLKLMVVEPLCVVAPAWRGDGGEAGGSRSAAAADAGAHLRELLRFTVWQQATPADQEAAVAPEYAAFAHGGTDATGPRDTMPRAGRGAAPAAAAVWDDGHHGMPQRITAWQPGCFLVTDDLQPARGTPPAAGFMGLDVAVSGMRGQTPGLVSVALRGSAPVGLTRHRSLLVLPPHLKEVAAEVNSLAPEVLEAVSAGDAEAVATIDRLLLDLAAVMQAGGSAAGAQAAAGEGHRLPCLPDGRLDLTAHMRAAAAAVEGPMMHALMLRKRMQLLAFAVRRGWLAAARLLLGGAAAAGAFHSSPLAALPAELLRAPARGSGATLLHEAAASGRPEMVDIVAAAMLEANLGSGLAGGIWALPWAPPAPAHGSSGSSSGCSSPTSAAEDRRLVGATALHIAAATHDGGELLAHVLRTYPEAGAVYRWRPSAAQPQQPGCSYSPEQLAKANGNTAAAATAELGGWLRLRRRWCKRWRAPAAVVAAPQPLAAAAAASAALKADVQLVASSSKWPACRPNLLQLLCYSLGGFPCRMAEASYGRWIQLYRWLDQVLALVLAMLQACYVLTRATIGSRSGSRWGQCDWLDCWLAASLVPALVVLAMRLGPAYKWAVCALTGRMVVAMWCGGSVGWGWGLWLALPVCGVVQDVANRRCFADMLRAAGRAKAA